MSDEPYVQRRGDEVILRVPLEDALAPGMLLVFAVAPFVWLGAWLMGWAFAIDAEGWIATFAVSSLGALVPGLAGIGLLMTARRRVARTEIRIDLAEKLLYRGGATPVVFREPRAVRVARAAPIGWALGVVDRDGRFSPLFRRVPYTRGRELAAAAERLADALDATAEIPSAARQAPSPIPRDPRVWAALSVAPIDGVFHAYAAWALLASRDRATKFVAMQSLATFGIEVFLGLLVLGCCGAPIAGLAGGTLATFTVALPLGALFVARVAIRAYAAYRAHRGVPWTMPWLAPFLRRYAPASAAPTASRPASRNVPPPSGTAPPPTTPPGTADDGTRIGSGPW